MFSLALALAVYPGPLALAPRPSDLVVVVLGLPDVVVIGGGVVGVELMILTPPIPVDDARGNGRIFPHGLTAPWQVTLLNAVVMPDPVPVPPVGGGGEGSEVDAESDDDGDGDDSVPDDELDES